MKAQPCRISDQIGAALIPQTYNPPSFACFRDASRVPTKVPPHPRILLSHFKSLYRFRLLFCKLPITIISGNTYKHAFTISTPPNNFYLLRLSGEVKLKIYKQIGQPSNHRPNPHFNMRVTALLVALLASSVSARVIPAWFANGGGSEVTGRGSNNLNVIEASFIQSETAADEKL